MKLFSVLMWCTALVSVAMMVAVTAGFMVGESYLIYEDNHFVAGIEFFLCFNSVLFIGYKMWRDLLS